MEMKAEFLVDLQKYFISSVIAHSRGKVPEKFSKS
jgi:hypothetical protein